MKIVDLSFPIRPHFRWPVAREIRSSHDRGDNFESSVMTLACHAYTHVDAPRHFLPGDRSGPRSRNSAPSTFSYHSRVRSRLLIGTLM
jgi:kynurenine formamidase